MIRLLLVCLCSASFVSPARAQTSAFLFENPAWHTANAPRSVECLDLDGDGSDDMLVAGRRGRVAVHLNTGDGTMNPPTFIDVGDGNPSGTETEDIAVGDLNGDGFPDFAVANRFSESLQTFINDGAGGFSLLETIASPNTDGFGAVAIGDANNDGLPDLVGVQPGPDFLQLYLALPGGGYDAPLEGFLINTPTQAAFGDADGDGLDDLFVIASDGPNPTGAPAIVAVFVNGGFEEMTGDWLGYNTLARFNETANPTPGDLELADMDGDGTLDIVVTTRLLFEGRGFVEYLPNAGAGDFGPAVAFEVGDGAQGLDVGDLNGDGLLDVVCANTNGEDEITVLLRDPVNRGSVDLSDITSIMGVNDITIDADLGDLDGDGDLDFIVGCIGGQSVNAMLNDGDGRFARVDNYAGMAPSSTGLVSLDIDDDGDTDLVNFNDVFMGDRYYEVATNDGSGNYTFGPAVMIFPDRFSEATGADFDGDGRDDVLIHLFETGELQILFNNGDGALSPGASFSSDLQTLISRFGITDANGDGANDIFVMGLPNGSSTNRNVLFLNDGAGSFTDASAGVIFTSFNTTPFPFDLDGDGDEDLVTTDLFYDLVPLRNNGDNTYTEMPTIPNPETFGSNTVVDDFDGDGNPDIAVANTARREVAVFPGDGTDFGFGAPVSYPTGAACRRLRLGDADGDGDNDLFMHVSQGNTIDESQVYTLGVLINNGDGTFGPLTGYHCRGRLVGLETGDFNGDGLLDAATGVNTFDETVFVFLQRGDDAPEVCPGDCDASGSVNFGDLVAILGEFGTPGSLQGCDVDGSGMVNFGDLVMALGLFGPCP